MPNNQEPMPGKNELLQQLRLDKNPPPPASGHFGWWLAAGALIVGAVIWKFAPVWNSVETPQAEAVNVSKAPPASVPESAVPLAGAGPEKILDASGYITARQM